VARVQISLLGAGRTEDRMTAAHATCDMGERLQEVLQAGKVTSSDSTSPMPGGYDPNFVQCPSETTSTEPSTTLMAVCSSMA
jgi:hypothetical protein